MLPRCSIRAKQFDERRSATEIPAELFKVGSCPNALSYISPLLYDRLT